MESVRGHRCGDGFRAALAAYLRDQAALGQQVSSSLVGRRQTEALGAPAGFVAGRDLDDHRLVALSAASAAHGGDRLSYAPGPSSASSSLGSGSIRSRRHLTWR